MHVQVESNSNAGKIQYTIRLSEVDGDGEEYRARLFLSYPGFLSYTGDTGTGLTVDTEAVLYDDWNAGFRPPRIDAHKFNTEVVVPLTSIQDNVIEFSGLFDAGSESYVESAMSDPVNVVIERKVSDIQLTSLSVTPNSVVFTTDDDLEDGTALTIDYQPMTTKHLLGPGGMRIFGTYIVQKGADGTYSYAVEHYSKIDETVRLYYQTARGTSTNVYSLYNAQDYEASVWEVCHYECDPVQLTKMTTETAYFDFPVSDSSQLVAPLMARDTVCLGGCDTKVVSVDGLRVVVSAVLEDDTVSDVSLMYAPRTPSKAIPANWPTVAVNRADTVVVENSSEYDHTENTMKMTAVMDTYFSINDDASTHNRSDVLVCASGVVGKDRIDSVSCIQFAPNSIESDNAVAELVLYVKDMNCSEATVILYQMDSAGWSPLMDYDTVSTHITGIPIGSVTLYNPAMKHVNEATDIPDEDMGDYGHQVHIPIDSEILDDWLSGTASYSPSIAIKVVGEGAPVVSFSSSDCDNISEAPFILLTGGEDDAVHPDPFDIEVSADTVEPGQVLRITPVDPSVNTFGNSIFNNKVLIGEGVAPILAGDPTYIDVYVPEVNGSFSVVVYRKATGSTGDIPLTTSSTRVYVKSDKVGKSIKLAEKKEPGVIDPSRVNATALYNRDMGFNNITEVTDETSLIQNVYSILLTNPGERLFSQNFGTGITERLFKLGSREEGMALLQECIQKVDMYEPRVHIDGDQSSCEFDDSENRYFLLLCCVLPSARTEYIKLPFKNRGRMV
jgi:phage baseplate assembly protein W